MQESALVLDGLEDENFQKAFDCNGIDKIRAWLEIDRDDFGAEILTTDDVAAQIEGCQKRIMKMKALVGMRRTVEILNFQQLKNSLVTLLNVLRLTQTSQNFI